MASASRIKFSSKDKEVKIAGLYDLGETIGRGHFAVVKLAKHVFTGETVAVKVIDKTKLDETSKSHLFQEVRCMKLVQHPHVVRLYEVIDTCTKLYLILEWGDGGDMYDHIMKHEQGLTEAMARRYFKQIVQAISYCHRLHVVHRDLKPENVVFFEKQGVVKLTDFGFSNKFVPGKKLETSCGSLAYSAPEILLGDSYDAPAVDVWSLGVILYMLVCGAAPFQEANDSETLTMILDCKYKLPNHVSQECHSLISQLLRREPNDRADLNSILGHSWMSIGESISGEVSIVPTILTPLISRETIQDEDHYKIIQRMTDGKIATKDEIARALERNEYSYITATYYLLAERLLKRHHMALEYNNAQPSSGQLLRKHHVSPAAAKIKLEPLALSPRVSPRRFQTDGPCDNRAYIDDDEDDYGDTLQVRSARIPGGKDRPTGVNTDPFSLKVFNSLISPPSLGRPVLFSQEEDEGDEDDDEDEETLVTLRNPANHFPRQCSLIREEDELDDDGLTDTSSITSLHRTGSDKSHGSPSGSYRKPPPANRTLHAVRSSPQLLNQISEEAESDEDILGPIQPPPLHRNKTIAGSPDMLRKYGRRRLNQRGTSCSSSDASDNEESETRKRKEKLKDKFQRKDSSDHSESDGGGSSGPPGGYGGGSTNNQDPPDSKDDDDDRGGGQGSGSGSSNTRRSNKGRQHSHNTTCPQDAESDDESRNRTTSASPSFTIPPLDDGRIDPVRKISNLSISSVISSNSLCSSSPSRSSKYIVDSACSTPRHKSDCFTLNELNKVRSRVLNLSTRDFTDVFDSLSREGSFKDGGTQSDRTSICSADCPQTRPRRKRHKTKTDINSNGMILEEKAKDLKALDKTKSRCCCLI